MPRLTYLIVFTLLLALPAGAAQKTEKTYTEHLDIVFAKPGGQPLKLDLYLPNDIPYAAPVVVYIHGGGWCGGDKAPLPYYIRNLLSQNFAVAAVNYRLMTQGGQFGSEPVCFPAQIHDVKGAVRWLRAHAEEYGLDPEQIAAWGESAGGHLAALLATSGGVRQLEGNVGGNLEHSSAVQAAVDYFGPTDLLNMYADRSRASLPEKDIEKFQGMATAILGGKANGLSITSILANIDSQRFPFPQIRQYLAQVSPMTYIDPRDPPIFIGHGGKDPLVPLQQSQRLHEAMVKAGVLCEIHIVDNAAHGGLGTDTANSATDFIRRQLTGESLQASQ